MRVPVGPQPHQHLVLPGFDISSFQIGIWWSLTVVLIYISLVIKDVEHFFLMLLLCLNMFFGKYLFRSLACF